MKFSEATILIDYISPDSLIAVFRANWNGSPIAYPRHFSTGYHPDSYHNWETQIGYLSCILDYLDDLLVREDTGPVMYIRMKDLPVIWKKPEATSVQIRYPAKK